MHMSQFVGLVSCGQTCNLLLVLYLSSFHFGCYLVVYSPLFLPPPTSPLCLSFVAFVRGPNLTFSLVLFVFSVAHSANKSFTLESKAKMYSHRRSHTHTLAHTHIVRAKPRTCCDTPFGVHGNRFPMEILSLCPLNCSHFSHISTTSSSTSGLSVLLVVVHLTTMKCLFLSTSNWFRRNWRWSNKMSSHLPLEADCNSNKRAYLLHTSGVRKRKEPETDTETQCTEIARSAPKWKCNAL